ncbi:MAG: hypothetical protein MUC97_07085 [Bernardetiaceae bacterium]|jgi:hypothetical protein|nr:hypothetical protein [Bernardetiaceae bacterium]
MIFFKRILLVLSIVGLPFKPAEAQTRPWADGRLTWSDFQGPASLPNGGEIKYVLAAEPAKAKTADTTWKYARAVCTIDQLGSWAGPQFRSSMGLRYMQVVFDLVELQRRQLQAELYLANGSQPVPEIVKKHLTQVVRRTNVLERETKKGRDSVSINL